MSIKRFNITELGELDHGKLALEFQHELGAAVRDITERPFDERPRRIALILDLKPGKPEKNGQVEHVEMSIDVKHAYPTKRSERYRMGVRGKDALIFNPQSANDPDQHTLDELTDKGE